MRAAKNTWQAQRTPGLRLTLFLALLFTIVWVGLPHQAGAQLLPEDPGSAMDPLAGDDEAVGRALTAHSEDEAAARARFGPPAPAREVRAGAVLSAIGSVREATHRVDVVVVAGLASVNTTLRFSNTSATPAEVRYRLSVPSTANLDALRVCDADRCRNGVRDATRSDGLSAYDDAVRARGNGASGLPVARATRGQDSAGDYIEILAAPVVQHHDLVVQVSYLTDARLYGGVMRLTLPARGADPRAAPSEVTFESNGMLAASIDGEPAATFHSRIEPWYPISMTASLGTNATSSLRITQAACGRSLCVRAYANAGPRPAEPADIVLLIDASPSTEGPARGRIAPAIAALLSNAPSGSTVRAIAFAARAEAMLSAQQSVESAPIVPLAQAPLLPLGASTRIETAWAIARGWLREPLSAQARRRVLVLVGDGGLSRGRDAENAFAQMQRARVPFNVINVADRSAAPSLVSLAAATHGIVVHAGAEAELAVRGQSDGELSARLSAIFAPVVRAELVLPLQGRPRLPELRAGEEVSWEGVVQRAPGNLPAPPHVIITQRLQSPGLQARIQPTSAAHVLVAVSEADTRVAADTTSCDPRGPSHRESGVNTDATPIALAFTRACSTNTPSPSPQPTSSPLEGRGIPAETVLAMLRQRLIPAARGCFRQDRRGRGDYSARAEYVFTLADREIVAVDITGSIAEPLRVCLRDAIDTLDVPRFSGTVIVRYPIRTEAAESEPVLELAPEVAREIDARFHDTAGVNSLR